MPRVCTICGHDRREEIDASLITSTSLRDIAGQFGTSKSALERHRTHIPAHLVKAQEAAEVAKADNLIGQVREMQARALGILDKAETSGDLRTALSAIRETRGNLELLAKLLGQLDERPQFHVLLSPEWAEVRRRLVGSLADYPDARAAAADALMTLEANGYSN